MTPQSKPTPDTSNTPPYSCGACGSTKIGHMCAGNSHNLPDTSGTPKPTPANSKNATQNRINDNVILPTPVQDEPTQRLKLAKILDNYKNGTTDYIRTSEAIEGLFAPQTTPTPVVSDELRKEIRASLEEVFEYGKSAIKHNPPLVEERRLMSIITSYTSKYEIDIRIDEAKDIRKNIESLGTEVYFAVQRINGHIDALKKQKEKV